MELELDGRHVAVTNAEKVLYPATGFTKRDLVAWVLAVAPAVLPHLAGRAVTLARFPDGVDGKGWYQTNCPPGKPDWLPTVELRGGRGQALRYCRLDDAAALAWAANTGAIELHPLHARADAPDRADFLVVDLDPVAPAGLLDAARVALAVRAALERAGLAGYAKTSGGRGLHVYAPLDGRAGFDRTKAYARSLAAELVAVDPARVADRVARAGRAGKVLLDWRQNEALRSTIAPWSLRAATIPLVSTPVRWTELERAVEAVDARALRFGPAEALERLRRDGDLFAPVLAGGPALPP